jgi:hypothetical protein
MHARGGKCEQGFGGKARRKQTSSKTKAKMGSEWILRTLDAGGVEWIQLAQDRDQWWAVVNTVMNLRVLA